MTAKWEKKEGNIGTLTFEVSAEKFNEGLDEAFKKVVKDVQLPGFRKGRVPRGLFEQRFGVESLYQDAIDFVLPEAYTNAIDEVGISPVDQPQVDVGEIEKDKPLVFTADVTVKPEVKLGEYKGLEVEDIDVTIVDEDVDEEIERERQKLAELVVKEEGEVEDGDTVVIDFEGFIDGELFEGGAGENHSLEIGSNSFIPGFEEQLIGKSGDQETDVEVTFPEDYHAEELANKKAVFKVKIHEIKGKELPELDDELAKDIDDEVETLAELKIKIKERLENERKTEADRDMRETLINQVSESAEIDIPEVMIESEQDRMLSEFEQNLQQQGMTLEMYSQFSGQDADALKEQMKEDAKKRIQTSLVLEAIATEESLEATEEDIDKEFETMSEMYGIELEQIKQMLGGNAQMMQEDIKSRKAIDFLVDNSKIK